MHRPHVLALAVSVLLASSALAELCPKCKGKMYIQNIGKCVACGGHTTSGAFKLCPKCSAKLGQCEHCRAPLAPAIPKDAIALDEKANGKTVKVAVRKTLVVRLAGNPTTGYSWTVKKLDGDALEQQGKLRYEPKKVARGIVGSGGTFLGVFKAVKPGKGTLTMAYARPWEKGKPPIKTFTVTIQVEGPAANDAP